jgi:ABC-type dipeptide/oligopeptide/nickel transport system ATPase subunit
MLIVNNITKNFRTKLLFEGVSFQIKQGEILGLVGKSGSGKTTLSNCIMGFEPIDKGNILWNDIDINKLNKTEKRKVIFSNIQMIFQNAQNVLHPLKTLLTIFDETIRSNRKLTGISHPYDYKEVLEQVYLSQDYLAKKPNEMSGGEKQRVSIARVLLTHPKLIIADEPFSSVDAFIKRKIEAILKDSVSKGIGMMLITHDIDHALRFCDRLAFQNENKVVLFNDLTDRKKIYNIISKGLI